MSRYVSICWALCFILYLSSEVPAPSYSKCRLRPIVALLALLNHAYARSWCIPNARATSEVGRFWCLPKCSKINWLPLQRTLGYRKTYDSFVISIHVTTYAERLTKIGLVVAKIFGRICRFLSCRPKRYSCYPRNLWGYWTDLDHICTWCSHYIAIAYFWIKTSYSLPFRNTSLPNEGRFANFAQNWLP